MSINVTTTFSVEDPVFQQYLFDANEDKLDMPPADEPGYSWSSQDQWSPNDVVNQQCNYVVKEYWQVNQQSQGTGELTPVGENAVIVIKGQSIDIHTRYQLYLSDTLQDATLQERVRDIFRPPSINAFFALPNAGLDDFKNWVQSKMVDGLTDDMFVLKNGFFMKKIGAVIDVDTRQRDALLTLYNQGTGHESNVIVLVGHEETMQDWAQETRSTLQHLDKDELLLSTEPAPSPQVLETADPDNNTDQEASAALDLLLQNIFPTNCGPMRPRQDVRLLSLPGWPEFKVVLQPVNIKIGCVTFTIYLPLLSVRLARFEVYIHYQLPQSAGNTLLLIAETCAKRSAVQAAVISIIICNPEAAGDIFLDKFKECMAHDIEECLNAGVFVVKVCTAWVPVL